MYQGYFFLGRPLFRIPLRVHWSIVFLVFLFGGPSSANPIRWAAVVFLVLAHEYGHAVVVRWAGAVPLSIELHGFGGLCRWDGYVTPIGRACIAWGGVWAQSVVFAAALIAGAILEPPDRSPLGQVLMVFVVSNAFMAAFNLIPFPPLDGAEAWKLPWLLAKRGWPRRSAGFLVERVAGPFRRLRLRWRTRRWKGPKGPTLH
jgi:stage IV sporulation protein FB